MKNLLLLLLILSFLSCNQNKKQVPSYQVGFKGALKNIMFKGDVTAKVDLSNFENTAHFYALGALENLKGEVQIFDGTPFTTLVRDSALVFDNSFSKKATLLVYAAVDKWKSISIPDEIVTYEELEAYISMTAIENKIEVDKPFPFLIEGTPQSFDWHVINWKDGDTEHSHEKHVNSGLHGSIKDQPVKILGFYSDSHHAIFTHHTTNMHLHVKTTDGKIAGHLDGVMLAKGMILKLPDIE